MYTRERCFLLGLCLLGGVTFCLTAVDTEAQIITISEMETGYLNQVCRAYNEDEDDKKVKDTNDKDTQRVQPLQIELQNDTTESKSTYTAKEANAKTTNEIKKKPVMDLKTRSDQKYRGRSDQKPIVKDDDSWRPVNPDVSMTSSISPTTISVRMNQSTTKIGADAIDVTIPFLLHGAPIAAVTKATPMTSLRDMSNNTVKVTDETTSSRGRALNISAPEPTNSLHANITDLSDVSMDEDDKEVEGGEYIAPHNETAINISSAELSKPGCIYENHNYSIGEKIVRGCEAKCVCSENGITNCQPVCNDRFIKASEEIDKPHCRKHVTEEEPCCALLVCESHFGNKKTDNETCMFGNRTVGRKERIEDGCSRICVCEDDGHLKCQPRCPPNETTTTANQHDRCVTLASPSDPCCNITYCDVTLGDHEIKSDNSTDLNVHLMNVKVLNSTAIKLKFSTKNPEDISVEISQNRHVWSQRKPDKDGVISNLIPARTYYIRTTEGSGTEPFVVILPAEVLKTNISEKTSDKNFCHYKGKSYKIGAEWYDDCVFYCSCLETGMHSCSTIMCPTDFGLDLINPDCFDWETVDFVNPKPPHCCPQEVLCRNDGSCNYEGGKYKNWSELPINVTGCEKRCYCEMGNVSCQPACPAVPALPPAHLPCTSNEAKLTQHPIRSCCLEWTCNRSSLHGVNVTTAYPGPLATNIFDRQTIDNTKRLNNKSETLKPSQEPEHSTFSLPEDPRPDKTQTDATVHGLPHYPMDPGYPTVPYSGPYNPDFISSHPAVENIFHLFPHTEKPTAIPKEKSKSKSDSKKPVELVKPYKEAIDHFPGPLSPDRFPQKATSMLPHPMNENQHIPNLLNTKKSQQKDHPIQLNSHSDAENIPPVDFDEQLNNFTSELSYQDSIPVKPDTIKPNIIVPMLPEKRPASNNPYVDVEKPSQGVRNTEQDILSDHLYHLINLQHPGGSIQPDHTLSQDQPSLYDQISSQRQPPNNRMPSGYFETPSSTSKKMKPHIFAQKDENGQVTYHIHTPNIPHSPQQIEELLEYINQHHSKPGPFQHYPGQPAVTHNTPSGSPPRLPLHTDTQIPHSGFTHLSLPFAAQTSNQSGQGHDIVHPSYSANIPGFQAADEIIIQGLEALDEHRVRVVFTIPSVLVGLHGRIELRYTSDKENNNVSTWEAQVYSLPNDLIDMPHLEFELDNLEPSTEYKVKITAKLNNLTNSPTSKIYSVRTSDVESILPPQIPVDTEVKIVAVNSTWINVMWRKFTEYELQFIDGVQLRYKEHDTHSKIYSATPLIHRAVTNYVIENLKPSTTYEVGIYFIPFPGQSTELWSDKTIEVTTSTEPDPYSFEVKVEIKTVKSTDVEVSWSGVPYPEDKYVNIFRAIYQSDTGKEDASTFKIAKRDSHAKTVISELKPGTRYRLWLEIYLTNGRIKKSNVQDFITKPGIVLPASVSEQAGKFTTLPLHEGDYYGPLVIVAIVASLAILSTLILLMMLMKRRTSSKADISPRKATSMYDNPSYKTCEEVVIISNGRNKTAAEHEMATITSNVKETI